MDSLEAGEFPVAGEEETGFLVSLSEKSGAAVEVDALPAIRLERRACSVA